MKPFRILAIIIVVLVGWVAIFWYLLPTPAPKVSGPTLVRGYLAVAVGRSA